MAAPTGGGAVGPGGDVEVPPGGGDGAGVGGGAPGLSTPERRRGPSNRALPWGLSTHTHTHRSGFIFEFGSETAAFSPSL